MNEVMTFARMLLDVVLQFVPHDEARQLLDEVAIKRSDAIRTAAFAAKFHGDTDPPDPIKE